MEVERSQIHNGLWMQHKNTVGLSGITHATSQSIEMSPHIMSLMGWSCAYGVNEY